MAGFNISMEQINTDYSRVVDISEEIITFKSELHNLYKSQEGICTDLRLASKALAYARNACKQAKKLYKKGKISKGKYSEYGKAVRECKDLIRTLTTAERKNSQAINSLRSAIKNNEKLLTARVDARYDWET
mgnify:CR=1 FL=1